jgi:hypothetical protein
MTVQHSTEMGFTELGRRGASSFERRERFALIQIKGGSRQGAEAWRERHKLAAIPVALDSVDASHSRRTL